MMKIALSWTTLCWVTALTWPLVTCGPGPDVAGRDVASPPTDATATDGLEPPTLHHLHINATDPERSLEWWQTVWPAGETTTVAGFPAFAADGIFHLYTQVDARAPGAFDPARQRSVPQSPFWTTGPSTDGLAFYERLTTLDPEGERFAFLPVYTGPE